MLGYRMIVVTIPTLTPAPLPAGEGFNCAVARVCNLLVGSVTSGAFSNFPDAQVELPAHVAYFRAVAPGGAQVRLDQRDRIFA